MYETVKSRKLNIFTEMIYILSQKQSSKYDDKKNKRKEKNKKTQKSLDELYRPKNKFWWSSLL